MKPEHLSSHPDDDPAPPQAAAVTGARRPVSRTISEDQERYRGASLTHNTLLNLLGQGAPLLVAVIAIPFLDQGLGTERYGLLLIVWMFLGYFSLFDLGLGRALTQLLSERLGLNSNEEIPALVWTALILTLGLGMMGGLALALCAPPLVRANTSGLSEALRMDALRALYVLAASVPLVISTASLRGVLEAKQRFDLVNAIRIPAGVFSFAGPLLILPFSSTLFAVVLALAASRAAAWLAHVYCCFRVLPELRGSLAYDRRMMSPLLRFGGWMTVSNLISPLMVYMDRFLIGALESPSAVAYYATPWEVVTKFLIIPSALVGVLFPSFSYWQKRDAEQMRRLYASGLKGVAILLLPLTFAAVLFAQPVLLLWMGPDYAAQAFLPMQILSIGVLVNGLAILPFALVQGLGRPDLTAKLHLLELPLYAGLLWWLLHAYGIAGAALAWLLRVALDLILLLFVSKSFGIEVKMAWKALPTLAGAIVLLGVAMLPMSLPLRLLFFAVCMGGYGTGVWTYWLARPEKAFIRRQARRYLQRASITSASP